VPNQFSLKATEIIQGTSPSEPLELLVELYHSIMAEPARLVSSPQPFNFAGNQYAPCAFSVKLPDDKGRTVPEAAIQFGNVSHILTPLMDKTRGFIGGKVEIFLALRSEPLVKNYFREFQIVNSSATMDIVSFTLAFPELLNKNIINKTYRQETFPGLF
jgi:Domain of unknown function (DUF1833)